MLAASSFGPGHQPFSPRCRSQSGPPAERVEKRDLLRLNFGIFALHAAQMAMFVVIPFALMQSANLDKAHHWQVYLPVTVVGFILMVPTIIYGEKKAQLKRVFVGICPDAAVPRWHGGLPVEVSGTSSDCWDCAIAFNILEAT